MTTSAVRIDAAASIVAASLCWLHRWSGIGADLVRPTHPSRCGWCDFPPAELLAAIEGFDHEGWNAKQFRGLPPSIRERLVREAQELEPMPAVAPAPADDRGEGVGRDSGAPDKDRMAATKTPERVQTIEPMAAVTPTPVDEEAVPWL